MLLIGIAGRKGAGKDTAADYLVREHGFEKRAFADPIKKAVVELFQLSPEQVVLPDLKERIDPRHGMSPRRMMQLVGTDMFRERVGPDFWLRHFMHWFEQQRSSDRVVVPDIRFQNELDTIRELGGSVIRLTRGGRPEDAHPSERSVDGLEGVDLELQNDSTIAQLEAKIERWVAAGAEEEKSPIK